MPVSVKHFRTQFILGLLLAVSLSSAQAGNCPFLPLADQTDGDGDGVGDVCDNCSADANADQRDTNADGYGNLCDADFNGNGIVDPGDFSLLKSVFGQTGFPDQDLNGNGIVDPFDFSTLKANFGQPPGPSGLVP